jgi:hypothetical protein
MSARWRSSPKLMCNAPMASFETDRPRHPAARAERVVRRSQTQALVAETAKVKAARARGAGDHPRAPTTSRPWA